MTRLLPIGSVVFLKGGQKPIMIYGRLQTEATENRLWDYIGCRYPEGDSGPGTTCLFDHEQIERVSFMGFRGYCN